MVDSKSEVVIHNDEIPSVEEKTKVEVQDTEEHITDETIVQKRLM